MKKLVAFVLVLATIFAVGIFVLAFVSSYVEQGVKDCDPEVLAELGMELGDLSPGGATGVSLQNTSEYVIPGVDLPEENIKRAIRIAEIVRKQGLPYKAAEIALITSRTEASYMNPTPAQSDRDSAGPFQQRPPWGSLRERMNYRKSTLLFLYGGSTVPDGYQEPGLTDISGWQTRPPGEVAQAVQISAYPDRYAEHIAEARLILRHIGWTPSMSEVIQTGEVDIPLEEIAHCMQGEVDLLDPIVEEALSHVGEDYSWAQPPNGSSFNSAMFATQGIDIPADIQKLVQFNGNPDAGVHVEWVPASGIDSLVRGDVLFWGSVDKEAPEARAPPFEIATYNLKTGYGYQARTAEAKQKLVGTHHVDIIGFQEISNPTMYREIVNQKFYGDQTGVYPRKAGKTRDGASAKVIVWDESKFELAPRQPEDIVYPRMQRERPDMAVAPVIKLRQKATGQEFYVINTHSTAYSRYARERFVQGKIYVETLQKLQRDGLPVLFTGDFNSGYWLRTEPGTNTTWKDDPDNLTYCQLSAGGLMKDARDASQGRASRCPRGQWGGDNSVDHVYVSSDVKVNRYWTVYGTLSDHDARVAQVTLDGGRGNLNPTHTGIYVGKSLGDKLKVATYNVHGSNHTAATGPNSGPARMIKAAALITREGFSVVGLQELQRNQRPVLMRELGSGWGIWPEQPVYRDSKSNDLANSQNSIVYDKSQVELIRSDSGSLPMPYYFRGKKLPRDIPLAKFQQLSSGKVFWVANTHDPAKNKHAKLRLLDAQQHARDMDALVADNQTVFFTGDFNSGYRVITDPKRGNHTLGDKRQNLTWCVMTKSGAMLNGYDAARSRTEQCPRQTSQELGVGYIDHVYVSADVDVSEHAVISKTETASDHPVVYVTASLSPATEVSTDQPSPHGLYVGPRSSDGQIAVQPVRKANFLGALRFSFTNVSLVQADGSWVLPLAKPYLLTNKFGQKQTYYSLGYHTGQDFAPLAGNDGIVRAATNGEVITVGWDPDGFGNYVVEKLANGHTLWYAHLSSTAVKVGDTLRPGQRIGIVGDTGNSFGIHLHYEERDASGNPIDPMPALRDHGVNP